ncbi:hypothetical protein OYT1_ch1615 [Ferriphaselus amnicola]|uniref:Uncharacterized protein n=1 Tax=Ferriphaselus amnicola TaxID=1188319 RepID=A0A2Z6GCW5_9PROT|nr:hypothetical protein OYT1_ch1615 [Ferriphaselus amnicola]
MKSSLFFATGAHRFPRCVTPLSLLCQHSAVGRFFILGEACHG